MLRTSRLLAPASGAAAPGAAGGRAAGAALAQLLELLHLFVGQDLPQLRHGLLLQVGELLFLVAGKAESIADERRQERARLRAAGRRDAGTEPAGAAPDRAGLRRVGLTI